MNEGPLADEPLMSVSQAAGRSGRKDISERHDAFLAERKRKRGR